MRAAARLTALALGATLACAAALAGAQQPAPAQKPRPGAQQAPVQQAPAQKARPVVQSATYHDTYEASRRLPTRGGACQRSSEDQLGAFCVKICKAGYDARDEARTGTRHCRSQKPLPPGVLPTSGQKELAAKPPAASKPAPKRVKPSAA